MSLDYFLAYIGASIVTAHIDCGDFCDAMTDTLFELMDRDYRLQCQESGGGTGYDDALEDTEVEWERSD